MRRIRRIRPACLAVVAAVLVAGWFILVPADYRVLGKDALWQSLMVVNIHFWSEAGYFAPESESRPLLHLWSLSLEEQFYVVFPLVLAALWPHRGRTVRGVLWFLAILSFAAAAVLVYRSPEATFYLLPTRAWELLAGSLLALSTPRIRGRFSHEAAGVTGLALLVVPALTYGPTTPFPGVAALPACLGATLVLWSGTRRDAFTARTLGWWPLREIGRRSYSAYLWHWPLIAFGHSWYGDTLPTYAIAGILVATGLLSWASFRWIEQPFRLGTGREMHPSRTFVVAGLASLAILLPSLFIITTRGVPQRFSESAQAILVPRSVDRRWEGEESKTGVSDGVLKPIGAMRSADGRPDFLLIGDSHGMAISPAVDAAARRAGLSGLAALRSSGFPGDGIWIPGEPAAALKQESHARWMHAINDSIDRLQPRTVVVCARWSAYLSHVPDIGPAAMIAAAGTNPVTAEVTERAAVESLSRLVRRCRAAGSSVVLLLEVPYQDRSPRHYALAMAWGGDSIFLAGTDRTTHQARQAPVLKVMDRIQGPGVRIVDLAEPLFAGGDRSCVGRHDGLWYADGNHLNEKGSR